MRGRTVSWIISKPTNCGKSCWPFWGRNWVPRFSHFELAINCSSEYIGPELSFYLIIRLFHFSASNIHHTSIRVVAKLWSNTLKRLISQQSEVMILCLPEPSSFVITISAQFANSNVQNFPLPFENDHLPQPHRSSSPTFYLIEDWESPAQIIDHPIAFPP
jgi:hypothetical protein